MYDNRGMDLTNESANINDKKREFLSIYIENKREAEYMSERILRLRSEAERMTASLKDAPGRSGFAPGQDRLQNCITEIMVQEHRYLKRLETNLRLQGMLEEAIDSLPRPFQRQLLRMKFIDGAGWGEISDTMGYTSRHLQRMLEQVIARMKLPSGWEELL
ncbi:MAG: hypothetical protein IJF27_02560 [Oscillospiraceae bacterium]|nr:hypothetical protein [Oscillospiraceae bacterium]MBQ3048858.1 hypothetical protein [Oscillospiraceae bacterium]MBQ9938427.1 hypothetical protein [Oscillospiraceae bacterium]